MIHGFLDAIFRQTFYKYAGKQPAATKVVAEGLLFTNTLFFHMSTPRVTARQAFLHELVLSSPPNRNLFSTKTFEPMPEFANFLFH